MQNGTTGNIKIENCYNIGKITKNVGETVEDNHGIAYITGTTNLTTIKNCYYLQGSCASGTNLEESATIQTTEKTETEMKKPDFVNDLNEGNEIPVWKQDENNANSGYPVLK